MVTLQKKKTEYLDCESIRLLGLIVERNNSQDKKDADKLVGSFGEMEYLDLSDKLIGGGVFYKQNIFGEKSEQWSRSENEILIGFDEDGYPEFIKFIDNLYKETQVCLLVSREFLIDCAFLWFVNAFKDKKIGQTYTSYIVDLINGAIVEWDLRFLLLYVHIKKPFEIGGVEFNYFKKEEFDIIGKHNPETQKEFQRKYAGRVYAKCTIAAEKQKAIEIGRELCSQAVDVLKICSVAMLLPQVRINFDLDIRATVVQKSEVFITRPKIDEITLVGTNNAIPYVIGDHEWDLMQEFGMQFYHNFLKQIRGRTLSELEQLLINAIRRFGDAFSTHNKHRRVVELFTIMESLLLHNANTPIIDSVVKYCSKITSKEASQRKEIASVLKKMYGVRSALIHHAKEVAFTMDELRYLQHIVNTLLINMMLRTINYQTKQQILEEIDEAINAAY